jgi:hypothetical protein
MREFYALVIPKADMETAKKQVRSMRATRLQVQGIKPKRRVKTTQSSQ